MKKNFHYRVHKILPVLFYLRYLNPLSTILYFRTHLIYISIHAYVFLLDNSFKHYTQNVCVKIPNCSSVILHSYAGHYKINYFISI
jgi:hypothetical protein